MAKIEKKVVTPKPITTFVLEISPEEASGLYKLVDYGTEYDTILALGLNDVRHQLNNSEDINREMFDFGTKATKAREPIVVEDDDEDNEFNYDYYDYDA